MTTTTTQPEIDPRHIASAPEDRAEIAAAIMRNDAEQDVIPVHGPTAIINTATLNREDCETIRTGLDAAREALSECQRGDEHHEFYAEPQAKLAQGLKALDSLMARAGL